LRVCAEPRLAQNAKRKAVRICFIMWNGGVSEREGHPS
jgi:hypothetical protein